MNLLSLVTFLFSVTTATDPLPRILGASFIGNPVSAFTEWVPENSRDCLRRPDYGCSFFDLTTEVTSINTLSETDGSIRSGKGILRLSEPRKRFIIAFFKGHFGKPVLELYRPNFGFLRGGLKWETAKMDAVLRLSDGDHVDFTVEPHGEMARDPGEDLPPSQRWRPEIAFTMHMVGNTVTGYTVKSFDFGSHANLAKIMVGDMITHFNGKPVSLDLESVYHFWQSVGNTLTVSRNGKTVELKSDPPNW